MRKEVGGQVGDLLLRIANERFLNLDSDMRGLVVPVRRITIFPVFHSTKTAALCT